MTSTPKKGELYVALIGDIRASRKVERRSQTQMALHAVLEELNTAYRDSIASRFVITLGDEFQGLLSATDHVLDMIQLIQIRMYPIAIRFGIGIGELSTSIQHYNAMGTDGPAYHLGRSAIEELKANEKRKQARLANILVQAPQCEHSIVQLINTALSLMYAIQCTWTSRQHDVVGRMLERKGTQTEVARQLGITQATVQKHLAEAHYYTYRSAQEVLDEAFRRVGGP